MVTKTSSTLSAGLLWVFPSNPRLQPPPLPLPFPFPFFFFQEEARGELLLLAGTVTEAAACCCWPSMSYADSSIPRWLSSRFPSSSPSRNSSAASLCASGMGGLEVVGCASASTAARVACGYLQRAKGERARETQRERKIRERGGAPAATYGGLLDRVVGGVGLSGSRAPQRDSRLKKVRTLETVQRQLVWRNVHEVKYQRTITSRGRERMC